MITQRDGDRLYEVFDLLAKADTMPEQLSRLSQVNDEIVNDPESSEIALAVAAGAFDGVTHSAAAEENVAVTAGGSFRQSDSCWAASSAEPAPLLPESLPRWRQSTR
jgi:hypothetical protein